MLLSLGMLLSLLMLMLTLMSLLSLMLLLMLMLLTPHYNCVNFIKTICIEQDNLLLTPSFYTSKNFSKIQRKSANRSGPTSVVAGDPDYEPEDEEEAL